MFAEALRARRSYGAVEARTQATHQPRHDQDLLDVADKEFQEKMRELLQEHGSPDFYEEHLFG
jgi:hypothetical protein